jgi:hypothetical protein
MYCLKYNLDILTIKYQNGEVLNNKPQYLSLNKNVKCYLLETKIFIKKIHDKMIQVDIGGHPPLPSGSKQFSDNFGNLLFLAVLTSGAILRA